MWKKYSKYIFFLGAFLVGGILVWSFSYFSRPMKQSCSNDYPFISGEIDCQNIDEKTNQVEGLRHDITQIIDNEKSQQHIIRASVFYRDLNTRRWFGVNDIDKFYPASLIKLPISIMYYKIAEMEPYIFDKELQIPSDEGDNSDQHYPPADPLLPGKTYTIKEMIRHMLIYSDNAPFSVLYDGGKLFRDKILSDLGVYEPPAGQSQEMWNVTARSYANIFRMLYNASYVSVQSANEILNTLSQSTFKNGIVAGVPETVKVSHKFGEAEGVQSDGTVQSRILNDCGIVYKPNTPYILCLMIEGQDYAQMETVMQKISKGAYNIAP
jgi:beta-lactamase class A